MQQISTTHVYIIRPTCHQYHQPLSLSSSIFPAYFMLFCRKK